jgi:hypothetical protein
MNQLKFEHKHIWKIIFSQQKTWIGLVLLIIVIFLLPFFFNYIQHRPSFVLNDSFLNYLPAKNVSVPIFIIIWGCSLYMLVRIIQTPQLFAVLLWSYLIMLITRIITLYLVPLAPPIQLINLNDPFTKIFYGNKTVVHDLFYSGHTATIFLFYLCSIGKYEKKIFLLLTFLLGFLLLLQHIHYSIDVLFAPIFAYFAYKSASFICRKF